MKSLNQENILIALAGGTLALCLASSALMTAPETSAARVPVHEALRRSAMFAPGPAAEMICDITAYCPGSCCNSAVVFENGTFRKADWSDRVASGDFSIEDLTARGVLVAAVDPEVIPYGSIIEYDGSHYIALDTGSAIRGNRIDLLLPGHERTVRFGRRRGETVRVLAAKEPKAVLAILRRIMEGGNAIVLTRPASSSVQSL